MAEHLIYLAAGSARRFGSNKLLCPVDGKPLFQHGLDTLARAVRQREDCTLTVVSRYPQILAAAQAAGGTAVDCPDSVLGLSYTIRAALDSLEPLASEDILVFAVADQPWLTDASVVRLLEAARSGSPGGTLCWESQVGSPTFFSAALVPQLRALTGDQGGRRVLKALGDACIQVPAENARELEDVDFPSDL